MQFRRGGNAEQPAGMEYQGAGRPGITIGGAEGVTSRFRAPRRGQEDRAVADAMQVSACPCSVPHHVALPAIRTCTKQQENLFANLLVMS